MVLFKWATQGDLNDTIFDQRVGATKNIHTGSGCNVRWAAEGVRALVNGGHVVSGRRGMVCVLCMEDGTGTGHGEGRDERIASRLVHQPDPHHPLGHGSTIGSHALTTTGTDSTGLPAQPPAQPPAHPLL